MLRYLDLLIIKMTKVCIFGAGAIGIKNIIECINILKKKNIHVSPWIEDIARNKKNKIVITKKTIYLLV